MFRKIIEKIRNVNVEAEYDEKLEHDIVIVQSNGDMVEVTKNGSEEGKQE